MAIPGLNPNIRLIPDAEEESNLDDLVIVNADEGSSDTELDEAGNVLRIQHANGDITVSIDGGPVSSAGDDDDEPEGWYDNLAKEIEDLELSRISDELLRGIEADISTRSDWIEDRAQGLKLLGLKIELPGVQGSSDGAPVEGMSKVRHPLLLEAVLRFQANARSELLPTDGPVKIRDDSNNSGAELDKLARALEKDMNHYLTVTAPEYYPDTDRMLFMLGFGGTAFKKVYFCPLRNRPVSETVDADDLIVNNNATDLQNAKRITHRSYQRPSTVKRLQILGVYRDIDLSTPNMSNLDSLQREKLSVQGIAPDSMNPNDRDREIYECNCELNIQGYEHKMRGKETGLEIPYRVTVDVSSKKVLSVVRNYNEDQQELPEARKNFVKYTYVPGMGFYDIGLLHILGNTTNAITAAWRELLDAGMYANFPGFLMADTGARQNTNIFRVPPGGGALVKTGGMPISQAIMPLPYKEPSGTLMGLVDNMAQTGMRLGGTSEAAVGEGRSDAPVGTTLAQIEQSQKVLNSVHKRMHASQAEEFQLLKEVFKEHPDSFWQRNKKPAAPWDEKTFLTALENYELIPQADPNTASQVQRLMKVMALKQLQAANPSLFDPVAIDTAALQAIGWSNPSQFLASPEAQKNPPPELIKMQADAKAAQTMSDAHMLDAQTKAKTDEAKTQIDGQKLQLEGAKVEIDKMKAQAEMKDKEIEAKDKYQERKFKEHVQLIDLAQNIAVHPESLDVIQPLIAPAIQDLSDISNPEQQPGLVPGLIPRDQ